MKRNAIDVLRRGFDNLLANWPLILIRIAEGVVFVVIVIASVVAAVIPVLVAAGMSKFDLHDPGNASQLIASLFIEHWVLLLYLLVLAMLILGVLIAIHSFVEAGSAQVYIDGERAAARVPAPARPAFSAFAADRWIAGGKRGWWAVFWIYNLAWSVGALILLIPVVPTIAGMLAVPEAGGRVAIGCAGLVLTVLLMVPTAIIIGMWTQRAIAVCVARGIAATESLRAAWREVKLDFGRHLAVALLLMLLSLVAASVIGSMTIPFSLGSNRHLGLLPLMFAPMQMGLSIVQSAVSAAMSGWFLASFVALTEER